MNHQNEADIIKNLINSMGNPRATSNNITQDDIRKRVNTIDKSEVIRKLNSMGLGKVSQMVSRMSDEDIIREISKNPMILKKVNEILKGDK